MRRALKILAFLLLGPLLLVAALYAALQSGAGQRALAARLPGLTGGMVAVEGLEGTLPQNIRLKRLTLSDPQGVWLEIEELALVWHPLAWAQHEVDVERLEIARVHVLRAPVPSEETMTSDEPFRFPDLPRLSVKRLAVTEIVLDEAVSGQAQRLTLSGQAKPEAAGQRFALALDTLEGTATQLRAEGTLSGQNLQASLRAQEAPGGLLGRLAQIAPEATLQLAGQGSWDGTRLNAQLRAAEDATLLADIALASTETADRYRLKAEGTLPSQLRNQPAFAPLRGEAGTDYALEGEAWLHQAAWHWRITQGRLGSLGLTSQGAWPQANDQPLAAQLAIEAPLEPWSAMAQRELSGQARIGLTADGTPSALRLNVQAALRSWRMDAQALPQTQLSAQVAQDGSAWNVGPLQLRLGDVTAEGQARYDAPAWSADFTLPPVALSAWRALLPPGSLPPEFGGTLGLRLQATGKEAEWHIETQAALDALQGFPEHLRGALGRSARLSARLAQADGAMRIEQAELTSAGGLQATVNGSLEDGVADLRAEATLADAHVLGQGIPGGVPALRASWNGRPEAGDATFRLDWQPTGLPKLEAEGKAALRAELIRLETLQARFGPAQLQAEGTLPRQNPKAGKAMARLTIPDLAPLGKLAGQVLSGSLSGTGSLDGKAVQLALDAKNIRAAGTAVQSAQLRAALLDYATLDGLKADLQGSGLAGADWSIDTLKLLAKGEAKAKDAPTPPISATLALQGAASGQPLALNAAGRWQQPKAGQHVVALSSLKGRALGEPVALAAPTQARFGPGSLTLDPMRLSWGALHASARLVQAKGQVDGAFALEKVALDQLRFASLPRGTAQAQATLTGPLTAPKADFAANLHLSPAESTQADIALKGDWTGGPRPTPIHAQLDATTGQGARPGTLSGSLATAGRLSLAPFTFELPPSSPLSGQLNGQLPLALLNPWLRAEGHKLEGEAKIALQLGGTLGAPDPQGGLSLSGVNYDNLPSGLCLRNLQGNIRASAQEIRLSDMTARDADNARMEMSGRVGLTGAKPVEFGLSMPSYRLFCGGMASGNAAGELTVRGNLAERLVAGGTLTLGPMAVTLPQGEKAGDIPQLTVIEPKKDKRPKDEKPGIVALDIDVSVPGRLFVRGRGLDAEFEGDLKVQGTANAPNVVGDLSTRRGRFTLLDRQLALTRAVMRFAGPIPPSPQLDILAETNVESTTLRVLLTGSAVNPQLKLESTPSLPSDEVLALLLFGRKLEDISAFQALQLAQAARQLAGKGGGPGAIDSVRNLLGLDTLSLDQDASGESTVGTGKYLADGVYVGLEQGRKPESRRVRTELEVIPDVNVQTNTTSDGQTGGGVEWKFDY